jgi:hypothetical protein
VSWWVGPPPGRSLSGLDELTTVLAANISRASDLYVEYERENDSHGRLIVSFAEVLARPSSPIWATDTFVDDQADDDLEAAIDAFDQERPALRLIDGEAQ